MGGADQATSFFLQSSLLFLIANLSKLNWSSKAPKFEQLSFITVTINFGLDFFANFFIIHIMGYMLLCEEVGFVILKSQVFFVCVREVKKNTIWIGSKKCSYSWKDTLFILRINQSLGVVSIEVYYPMWCVAAKYSKSTSQKSKILFNIVHKLLNGTSNFWESKIDSRIKYIVQYSTIHSLNCFLNWIVVLLCCLHHIVLLVWI